MVLSITQLLVEGGETRVVFVCSLEGIEEFSMRLRRSLELAELSSCEIIGDGIDVCSKTAECIGDDVGFASLVFNFEVVCLDGEDPANNTISGRGG